MSEGRSPERLCGAAACGRDLVAKPSLTDNAEAKISHEEGRSPERLCGAAAVGAVCWRAVYFDNAEAKISRAIGAAVEPPSPSESISITATASFGFRTGAKAMNQPSTIMFSVSP